MIQQDYFQCEDLLERFKLIINSLSLGEYALKSQHSASIGEHLRHCIDFANTLVRDVPNGKIYYDNRERSDLLENNPQFALMALSEKFYALADLTKQYPKDYSLEIYQSTSSTGPEEKMHSNLLREVVYVQDHAIHHLAIIQSIACSLGKKIPVNITENYSTQKHNKSLNP